MSSECDDGKEKNVETQEYILMRRIALIAGPIMALLTLLTPSPGGLSQGSWRLIGLLAWMVSWWLTEAMPLAVTALLPIPYMPLVGIADEKVVTSGYAHPLIYLFLGGFIISLAMTKWGLHKRIALTIVSKIGSSPPKIVAGFMVATAFLSMWISNTATAIMMFAVGYALIGFFKERGMNDDEVGRFGKALMLSIAYSASIGGVGTLIGTPPNALLASVASDSYGLTIGFSQWMLIGIPFVIVFLPLAWYVITRSFKLRNIELEDAEGFIQGELDSLGPMKKPETMVLVTFALAALAFITRKWVAQWTGLALTDTTIAMAAALILFALPLSFKKGEFVQDWENAKKLPWGVLLIFGGGLALAGAFQSTGLSTSIGGAVSSFSGVNSLILVLIITTMVVFLTELTSNTATTAIFLPLMGAIAVGLGFHPLLFMVPVTLAASMAFMMPVATPPNAIIFGYEGLRIKDMARTGIWLNLLAICIIVVMAYFLGPLALGFTP